MYNGLKDTAEKQAGHFLDSRVQQINDLSKFMDTPLLLFVHMMQNFMVTGGMKVHTGYIFCLKKSIMINVILN